MTELQKATYHLTLKQADNALILGQRLSEWCGHGPILEEDIALTNIALDLVGRARSLYAYAITLNNEFKHEDHLAYRRDAWQFKNFLLCEQPNGDYAQTIVRSYLFDVFSLLENKWMLESKDSTLSGIASKSVKEVKYHLEHNREWLFRLGDGTEESHNKTQNALNLLWRFTDDMFDKNEESSILVSEKIYPNLDTVKEEWLSIVSKDINSASLELPSSPFQIKGSISGKHTEHLGYILAEMQYLQRAYPDAKWD